MSRATGLVIICLLALPLLPAAVADPPKAQGWAPYDTTAQTSGLAFARQGPTIAVALQSYSLATGGNCAIAALCPSTQPSGATVPDLSILQADAGWVHNGTGNLGGTQPLGRSLVAVTPDGHVVASVGMDRTSSPSVLDAANPTGAPNPSTTSVKLYMDAVPLGGNFSTGPETNTSLYIPGVTPYGLALSDDGTRVGVLVDGGGGNLTLLAYNYVGNRLNSAFSLTWPGIPAALAADGPMSRLLVGADFTDATNQTRAGLAIIDLGRGVQTASYSEPANGTRITSMAATPDGRLVALGTNVGRVDVIDGLSAHLLGAYQAGASSASITPIAIAGDGSRIALDAAGTLTTLTLTGAQPSLAWTTPAPGHTNSLSYNATGALLVASFDNSSTNGAYGFAPDGPSPLWNVPGSLFDAKVNDAATQIAYRGGHNVGAVSLSRGFMLQFGAGGKTTPVRPLRAGSSTTFDVLVSATGNVPETVALATTPDPYLQATLDMPVVTPAPGAPRHVNVTLTATPQFTGSHSVTLLATGLSTSGNDAIPLGVSFQGVANITFQVNQTDYVVTPGQSTLATINVINNGTSDAAVGLSYTQTVSAGNNWGVAVDQTSFNLPQGSTTPIGITVTPPADAPNGTSDAVVFTLQGPNVSDTLTLNFRLNPNLGVHLSSSGLVKYVAPAQSAFYNVTVTNNGTIARSYYALYDETATNNHVWAVQMSQAPFPLTPGQSRTLQVIVQAPGDVTPSDHVAILIRARTVPQAPNETYAEDNITLFAQAVAPPITTPTPTSHSIPFLAPGALVALATLAAFARRRRLP